MTIKLSNALAVSAFTLLLPLAAQAAEETASTTRSNHFGLSFNIDNSPMMYHDKEDDYLASISPQYRGTKFNLDGESISYKFLDSNGIQLEALAKSEARGYESDDDAGLAGMADRDASFDAGIRAGYKTPYGLLSLDATKDISDKHKGTEAELRFGREFYSDAPSPNRTFSVGGILGAKWQSDKTVNYYYGVKNSEATSDREAYEGKSAITPFIGLEGQASITKNVSFNASAVYFDQPDEIKDSPLAADGRDVQFNAGVTYWFN